MKEDKAYLEVAQRFIESSKKHIEHNINIQEVIGFKAYHAFESIGGAFNSYFSVPIPNSHPKKISAFVANSNRSVDINQHAVAAVAITLSSMRNRYLYPEKLSGKYKNPKDQISMTQAKELVRRVDGIVKKVERIIC